MNVEFCYKCNHDVVQCECIPLSDEVIDQQRVTIEDLKCQLTYADSILDEQIKARDATIEALQAKVKELENRIRISPSNPYDNPLARLHKLASDSYLYR